ncbi:Uncharacterised protein [uncultured archaeon]|nr:Uncharacterised protein [uncultured archaeon]
METDTSSLTETQIDQILTQYRNGNITIGCAARMAGIPLREMIAIAAGKGIPFQYSLDDLKEDYAGGRKLMHLGLSIVHMRSFRNC